MYPHPYSLRSIAAKTPWLCKYLLSASYACYPFLRVSRTSDRRSGQPCGRSRFISFTKRSTSNVLSSEIAKIVQIMRLGYSDLHAFLENLLGNLRPSRSCILDVRAFCLDELLAKIQISLVEEFQKSQEISEILASLDNRWNNASPLVRKRCSVDGIKRNSLVVDRTNRTKLVLRTSYVHIRATRYNANGTLGNLLYIGNRVIADFVV